VGRRHHQNFEFAFPPAIAAARAGVDWPELKMPWLPVQSVPGGLSKMKSGLVKLSAGLAAAIGLFLLCPAQAQEALVDTHIHLHHWETSLAEYQGQAAKAKLDPTTMGIMWFGGPNQALQGDIAQDRINNDRLMALAATNPKLLPIVTVHPYDGDAALAELQRIAAKGAKVLKIHPHTQKFDPADPRVLTLVKRAGELGMIVLMDNASIIPGDCEKLFNLALEAPKTTFIFAHLGALNFRFWNILAAARTADGLFANNIYFDVSATVVLIADSPIKDEFVWTMRNVGMDHLILGSDFPQYSLAQNVQALDRLGLSANDKAAIRYRNAQKLFHLGGH
jgi:uncharacterized protein